MENDIQYIAYLRVSTQKQGFSGLGLEAQKEIIQNFLYDKNPIAEYTRAAHGTIRTNENIPVLRLP